MALFNSPKLLPETEHRESRKSDTSSVQHAMPARRRSRWDRIPYPVAHFLGHRRKPHTPLHPHLQIVWSFIGIFSSIAAIAVVSQEVPLFRDHGGPIIVGSFGAAAVLEFHAIESPLAQPRNAVLSQIIASVVGVGVCKLFKLSPDFESIRWVAGALSCAIATSLMALTGTIHPPAGATALIAVVDSSAEQLGWYLILLVMLGCAIMLFTALVLNNIQRRFPIYWWSPGDLDVEVLEEEDPSRVSESRSGHPILDEENGRGSAEKSDRSSH